MLLGSLQMHHIQPVLSSSHHHLTSSVASSSADSIESHNLTHQLYYPLAVSHSSYQQQALSTSHHYQHRLSVKHESDSISNPRTATPSSLDSCSSPAESSYFSFRKSSYDPRSLTTVPAVTSSSMYSMKACRHSFCQIFQLHTSLP